MDYDQIKDLKYRLVIYLANEHGLKPGDIVNIKTTDIKPNGIQVRDTVVPLSDNMVKTLGLYVSRYKGKINGYLFFGLKKPQLNENNLVVGTRIALKKLGLKLSDISWRLRLPKEPEAIPATLEDIINLLNNNKSV